MAIGNIPLTAKKFLSNTGLSIENVGKISGIDPLHLKWAIEGTIELDEAHYQRLEESIPGIDLRGLKGTTYRRPLKKGYDDSQVPEGTEVSLLNPEDIEEGDFLRYIDENRIYHWLRVDSILEEKSTAKTIIVLAGGAEIVLESKYLSWVAIRK